MNNNDNRGLRIIDFIANYVHFTDNVYLITCVVYTGISINFQDTEMYKIIMRDIYSAKAK